MTSNNNPPLGIFVDGKTIACLREKSRCPSREQAFFDLLSRRVCVTTPIVKNDRTFILQEGEAETSINVLAEEWNWDRKKVRRFLAELNELGIMQTRRLPYGSISTFPTNVPSSPSHQENSSPSTHIVDYPSQEPDSSPSTQEVLPAMKVKPPLSVRYDQEPMDIEGEIRDRIRHAYELFRERLPLLDCPEYSDRTEKAIYSVFVLGMNCDEDLLQRYLDTVAKNPMLSGKMAKLTGNRTDMESFVSLFSPRWQELLFPPDASRVP